jgi:hypothetical protein
LHRGTPERVYGRAKIKDLFSGVIKVFIYRFWCW